MLFSAILLSGFLAGLSSVSAAPVTGLHQVDTASLRARGPDARIHARGRSSKDILIKTVGQLLILDLLQLARLLRHLLPERQYHRYATRMNILTRLGLFSVSSLPLTKYSTCAPAMEGYTRTLFHSMMRRHPLILIL